MQDSLKKGTFGAYGFKQRRLSEELEECGEDYCNYKNIKINDLELLLVQNISDIREMLLEFFRLKNFRKRQEEKQKHSIKGILNVAMKRTRRLLSSKNFEHMDRIIEEYLNIE